MKIFQSGMTILVMAGLLVAARAETVTRKVPFNSEITRIYLNGTNELHVTQGEEEFVELTAPEEMLAQVEARVKGRSLYLGREENWEDMSWGSSEGNKAVRFNVQLTRIDAIRIRGSGHAYIGDIVADRLKIIMYGNGGTVAQTIRAQDLRVEMAGNCQFQGDSIYSHKAGIEVAGNGKVNVAHLESGELEIDIAGNASLKLEDLKAGELETEINGNADLHLAGRIGTQDLEINGSGNYRAPELISDFAYIEIRGSGDVEINVQKQLTAEIMRGSDLVYHGGPELEADISGKGKYRKAGNSPGAENRDRFRQLGTLPKAGIIPRE